MKFLGATILAVAVASAIAYSPHGKESFLTDALLREVLDRMGKDLTDATNAYLDFPESRLDPAGLSLDAIMPNRAPKQFDNEDQFLGDYDPLTENQHPTIRDQEYLQHSSLWGHQYMTGGAGEGKQRLKPDGTMKNQKEVKTDAVLPAYCNPPNPCPAGHAEDGCLEEFENTAAFSREFQAAQDCMCDTEHMFDCPSSGREPGDNENGLTDSDIDRIMQQIQVQDQHKSLVAKKFHSKKDRWGFPQKRFDHHSASNQGVNLDGNPFLKGDKLPVAAKKGLNVY